MKILLDESVHVRFRKDFPAHHDVYTVRFMGWLGVKNGALLKLISENGFDCWITADQSIPYQQNAARFPCLVVVLELLESRLANFRGMLPRLIPILDAPPGEKLVVLEEA